ncbi:MAG: hypothetical protein ABI855_04795 [Bacteroidota bacterium]
MTDPEKVIEFIKSEKAIAALYGYASSLMRNLHKREGAKEAKDYVIETQAELYLKSREEDIHNLFDFCKTIMWRKIMGENKKMINNQDDLTVAMHLPTEEKRALEKEEIKQIDQFMQEKYSNETDQKIYTSHFHKGLPVRKITAVTGGNYNTVRNTLSEMRRTIKECYTRLQVS